MRRIGRVARGVVGVGLGWGGAVAVGAPVPYEGSWINDTFGSMGPASGVFDLTPAGVTLEFDLGNGPGGSVLGQPVDPGPVTIVGTSNPDTSITVSSITPNPHPVYGNIAAVIASPSNVTVTMTAVPSPGIAGVVMTGGVTSATTMAFNYTVSFVGGGQPALGRVLLTQVPEAGVGVGGMVGVAVWVGRRRRGR